MYKELLIMKPENIFNAVYTEGKEKKQENLLESSIHQTPPCLSVFECKVAVIRMLGFNIPVRVLEKLLKEECSRYCEDRDKGGMGVSLEAFCQLCEVLEETRKHPSTDIVSSSYVGWSHGDFSGSGSGSNGSCIDHYQHSDHYRVFDSTGKGWITLSDFERILASVAPRMAAHKSKAIFAGADIHNVGQVSHRYYSATANDVLLATGTSTTTTGTGSGTGPG
mmetsp:Transcript_17804/g.29870  ORF Transcript_17804/g.29870 Transcript_17804/m.29870 type:complete len:222 (-) Transcript_17804:39-704(-)